MIWHPPLGGNHALPTKVAQSEPRTFLLEIPLIAQHCNKAVIAEVKPFYWRPNLSSFSSIDAVLYTDNTIFIIQATIAGEHPPITSIDSTKAWKDLMQALKGLVALGAYMAYLYLVDSHDKGAQLCENDAGSAHPVGYCDIKDDLSPGLSKYRVSTMTQLITKRC